LELGPRKERRGKYQDIARKSVRRVNSVVQESVDGFFTRKQRPETLVWLGFLEYEIRKWEV